MSRLFFWMLSLIGPSLAGAAIVVVLVAGMDTLKPILIAAAAGFIASVPVALLVTRRLQG